MRGCRMLGAMLAVGAAVILALAAVCAADGCGELNQPCCSPTTCNAGLGCFDGTCETILCYACLCENARAFPTVCSGTPIPLNSCPPCPAGTSGPVPGIAPVPCAEIDSCPAQAPVAGATAPLLSPAALALMVALSLAVGVRGLRRRFEA